jgi:hypothetical protein
VTAYSFYVHDTRYSVPMLEFVMARDLDAAKAMARRRLGERSHYTCIDVYERDILVASVAAAEAV